MASSRKPRRSRAPTLLAAAAARLKEAIAPGDHLVLGLSGGIDSVVLFDVLTRLAERLEFTFEALHVNHQLSPHAPAWARFCRELARSRGVRIRVIRVSVARANSVERAAREARHAALRAVRADHIVLAHNRDDQAETLLLNLIRGAGVRGLAAMAPVRVLEPLAGARARSIVRPLLDVPRSDIERYARTRRLQWVEDESNADAGYTRNWLRHAVLPRLAERVPSSGAALARSASHMSDAAALLDELARIDLREAAHGDALSARALRALTPGRARNLLRHVIASRGWRMPDAQALDEALRQALRTRRDARPAVALGDCELRRHGDDIHLAVPTPPARGATRVAWHGEREVALPALGGVLHMARAKGIGLSMARLGSAPVTLRSRTGGERLQPAANRPRRTVKNLLQEARVPPWRRERLPFIYCGETLACVPGVAIDCRFRAAPGEPSVVPEWREPARAAAGIDLSQSPCKKKRANLTPL